MKDTDNGPERGTGMRDLECSKMGQDGNAGWKQGREGQRTPGNPRRIGRLRPRPRPHRHSHLGQHRVHPSFHRCPRRVQEEKKAAERILRPVEHARAPEVK